MQILKDVFIWLIANAAAGVVFVLVVWVIALTYEKIHDKYGKK
jgi:uncharacterized membrane protein